METNPVVKTLKKHRRDKGEEEERKQEKEKFIFLSFHEIKPKRAKY